MVKPPKNPKSGHEISVDPKRGDAILKRMLQTKPKQHNDMIAERKAEHGQAGHKPKRTR